MEDASMLPAGGFAEWLAGMRQALRGEADSTVPCGTCTACCRSSHFIHIGPEETATLAAVPPALLFPAPMAPEGTVLLGYDEHGHCPMLVDDACSIYEHRPRACRTYDCRIFAATGVEPDDDKPAVAVQVRRWRFELTTEADRAAHDRVRAAVPEPQDLPSGAPATQKALVAIRRSE